MNPTIIEVKTFDHFTKIIDEMEHRYWVFRGHGHVGWHIEPTLARYYRSHQKNIQQESYYPRESDAIKKFCRSAHLHLSHLPAEKDYLNWLAIMQHFGSPTRLIDFTFSPFVALFFALESSSPNIGFDERLSDSDLEKKYRPYEVHAVHLKSVRIHTKGVLGHNGIPSNEDYMIGQGDKQTNDFASFFEGNWQNQRQVAQQGLFMVPSRIELDIETYLRSCPSKSKSYPDTSWFTFRFPGGLSAYNEMVTRLLRANVSAEALFPGLEGIARSLSMRYYEPKIKMR